MYTDIAENVESIDSPDFDGYLCIDDDRRSINESQKLPGTLPEPGTPQNTRRLKTRRQPMTNSNRLIGLFMIAVLSASPTIAQDLPLPGENALDSPLAPASESDLPVVAPKLLDVPETLPTLEEILTAPPQITIHELIAKAEQNGFKQADIVTAAKLYHQQPNIYRLSSEQVADLDRRMTAKIEKVKQAREDAASQEGAEEGADSVAAAKGGRNTMKKTLVR